MYLAPSSVLLFNDKSIVILPELNWKRIKCKFQPTFPVWLILLPDIQKTLSAPTHDFLAMETRWPCTSSLISRLPFPHLYNEDQYTCMNCIGFLFGLNELNNTYNVDFLHINRSSIIASYFLHVNRSSQY